MLHVAHRASDEIAGLNREIERLRCALADIEAMAQTLKEAKAIASKVLAPGSCP